MYQSFELPGQVLYKNSDIKVKFFGQDFFKLVILVLITFLLSYYAPKIITQLFLFTSLLIFINSKANYFWVAYFLVLFSAPFGLFAEAQADLKSGLPLFKLFPGISLNFYQLFVLSSIYKSLTIKKTYKYFVHNQLIALFVYFFILLILAFILHHSTPVTILYVLRDLLLYAFIFTLPKLVNSRIDFYRLLYLIIPFVTLHFADNIIFSLNGGRYLVLGIDRNIVSQEKILVMGYRFILFGGMFSYIFITFFSAMLLLLMYSRYKLYISFIIAMAFFVVLAGGFRSWFLIFSIGFATYLFVVKNKFSNSLYILIFVFLISNILGDSRDTTMFRLSFERALGVFDIFEPDSQAATSIEWKTEGRLPGQLELISKSPITGWGFTKEKGDPDVGNFGMLVEMGIIGFLVYLVLWIGIIKMFWRVISNAKLDIRYRKVAKVLLAGFIGLLISHFTTNQIFGIGTFSILISFYIYISDFVMKEAYNTLLNNKQIDELKQ